MPSKKKAKPTQGNVARTVAGGESTAKSKAKKGGPGNPEKIKPYQWKPGESGNPGGRVKNPLSDALRQRLTVLIPNDKERRDWAAATMQSLVNEGVKGNINAIALMFDRLEGKATTYNPVFQALRYSGCLFMDVITSVLPTNRPEFGWSNREPTCA